MIQQRRSVNKDESSSPLMHHQQLPIRSRGMNGKSSNGNINHRNGRKGLGLFFIIIICIPIILFGIILYKYIITPFINSHQYLNIIPFLSSKSSSVTSSRRKPLNEEISTISGGYEYHIVFSTGCSLYQDWQSYVFFYGAVIANQPGTITRIVSGCKTSDEEDKMRAIFQEEIHPMEPTGRFKIHFTPDYSKLKNGKSFVYFNKPFGMKHWLENALGFPNQPINDNAIIILVDPDQLIMRPFTNNNFSNTEWKFLGKKEPYTQVVHGRPMGQLYGFGVQWKNQINMTQLGFPNSPVDQLSYYDAQAGYIVGPPYVATARDMYRIVDQWTIFAHGVHDQYPFLLAEMFAYCLGAAHQKLPHQTARSFMISDISAGKGEGWTYIDKMPDDEVCNDFDVENVPNVLHYCQRYGMGNYFFGKRKLPKDFLSCQSPLLAEPPKDILSKYNYANFPANHRKEWTPLDAKRNAFTICYMIKVLNEAATHFKNQHCDTDVANYQKTLLLSDGAPGADP
jgi:peptidyl serine alpha-galactosyltransferase